MLPANTSLAAIFGSGETQQSEDRLDESAPHNPTEPSSNRGQTDRDERDNVGPPPPYTSPARPPAPATSRTRARSTLVPATKSQGSNGSVDLFELASTFPHGEWWLQRVGKKTKDGKTIKEAPKDQHKRWVRFKFQADFGV